MSRKGQLFIHPRCRCMLWKRHVEVCLVLVRQHFASAARCWHRQSVVWRWSWKIYRSRNEDLGRLFKGVDGKVQTLDLGWILGMRIPELKMHENATEKIHHFFLKICRYWIADKNKTPSRIKGLKGVKYVALGRGTPRSYAASLQSVQKIVKPRLSRAAWVDLQSESPQQHVNKPSRSSFHWFQGVREVQWDTGEARSFATCLV